MSPMLAEYKEVLPKITKSGLEALTFGLFSCWQIVFYDLSNKDFNTTAHTHLPKSGKPLAPDKVYVPEVGGGIVDKDDPRITYEKEFELGEPTPLNGLPHQHSPYDSNYSGDGCHYQIVKRS